jgi:glycosyltransferase involved in cell wall biosynthesis
MRVLQVIGGTSFGGGIRVITSLCHRLRHLGFSVVVNGSDPYNLEIFRNCGCEILDMPNMRREINPWHDVIWAVKLAKFIRKNKIDIVHTHTSKGGMIGRFAARMAATNFLFGNRPLTIHTVHGFAFHEFSPPSVIRVCSILERIASRWTDKVVFVNEFHQQWAKKLSIAPPSKMVTISNGIPAEAEQTTSEISLRHEYRMPENAYIIGSIGRLAPQKGLEYLIKAMPKILTCQPNTYAVLVGEGSLRNKLEKLANTIDVGKNVIFTGFVPHPEALLPQFDLIVLPSLREGLSIALLEAMRAGKPIITTAIGSNLSVVVDNQDAIVVPPADVQALCNSILHLLQKPHLRQLLGQSAQKTFLTKFTEEQMLAKYEALYLGLLQDSLHKLPPPLVK